MKTIALNFATNIFGKLSPDVKKRLQDVIDNPNQETWDDAYCIIINASGRTTTLWQAVIAIDPDFVRRKPLDAPWPKIPSSETIVKAIRSAVFKQKKAEQN